MNAEQPIGFFDSGIGGLTVANAVLNALPNERIIYFGDSLHFPYGEKSQEAIEQYSLSIAEFLSNQNCKCIVIACNSASASAYQSVQNYIGDKAIVVDVIDPTVYFIKKHLPKISHVGVIATRRTIKSEAYKNGLHSYNPNLKVSSLATPLLAPMIEEGFTHPDEINPILRRYLSHQSFRTIEALILACTHYPVIRNQMTDYFNGNVHVLDTPTVIAEYLKDKLGKLNLLSSSPQSMRTHQFFVSEVNDTIQKTAKLFFNHEFTIQEKNIFK